MDSRDAARPPALCIASISSHQPGSHDTLFCAACERRVDGFCATLVACSSLESALQAPTLKSQSKAKEVGHFPFCIRSSKVLHWSASVFFSIIWLNGKAPSLKLWWGIRHELRNWTQISHGAFSYCPW